jgi:hypothetical protein
MQTARTDRSADQEKAKKDIEAKRARFNELCHTVFDTEAGAELMEELLTRYNFFGRSFIADAGGSVCPLRAAIREGEKVPLTLFLTAIADSGKKTKHIKTRIK